jgi:hypothetical protein
MGEFWVWLWVWLRLGQWQWQVVELSQRGFRHATREHWVRVNQPPLRHKKRRSEGYQWSGFVQYSVSSTHPPHNAGSVSCSLANITDR